MYTHNFECQLQAHHIFLNLSQVDLMQECIFQFAPCVLRYKVLQCSTGDLQYALCILYHMLVDYSSDVMQLAHCILDSNQTQIQIKQPTRCNNLS